jgi:hypothetical protein
MDKTQKSIFQTYYRDAEFFDRYIEHPDGAVDVIIPVIHTNELWEANLFSIYREIPVRRLLIGDGGCIDNSIEIAGKFPRVEVLDHRAFVSLGYSLRKLIEAVKTEWFVYLHSDVYLPPGWFGKMSRHQDEYDWFECRQRITALIEYEFDQLDRALSGAQMGRAKALQQVVSKVEDDYLYRTEDIVLAGLVTENGYRYGYTGDVFHYHQAMYKQSAWLRKIKSVTFHLELGREEEVRTAMMQIKGLVKYLAPAPTRVPEIIVFMDRLQELGELTYAEFLGWVKVTNPNWLPLINKALAERVKKSGWRGFAHRMLKKARGVKN